MNILVTYLATGLCDLVRWIMGLHVMTSDRWVTLRDCQRSRIPEGYVQTGHTLQESVTGNTTSTATRSTRIGESARWKPRRTSPRRKLRRRYIDAYAQRAKPLRWKYGNHTPRASWKPISRTVH